MDKSLISCGALLVLAGLVGIIYGAGINVQAMMARGATDYSFITAYITEWVLVSLAGVMLIVTGVRRT